MLAIDKSRDLSVNQNLAIPVNPHISQQRPFIAEGNELFSTVKESLILFNNKLIFLVYLRNVNNGFLRIMARKDDITGKGAQNGYRSSKSNNKTKHKFQQNLQKKRFYVPEEDKWVTLKVSTKKLRTINKKGISAVLNEARRKGTHLKDV